VSETQVVIYSILIIVSNTTRMAHLKIKNHPLPDTCFFLFWREQLSCEVCPSIFR